MEFNASVAAASPPPPKRKAGRKKSRETARHHPAHRGGAKQASELPRRTEIEGQPATLPDAAGPTAAGTSEGGKGVEAAAAKPVFVDEEAVFNMPELVEDMARGMLVAPPAIHWEEDDQVDSCLIDLSLWKHD